MKEADGTLRFITADGRTLPRRFVNMQAPPGLDPWGVRETAAVYRLSRHR